MLEKNKRERIIALVNKEVVPAIGCTEPMAVALCTAQAATTLGKRPERIEVLLSPNMLKNAMGVGIPGTGMIGLPIAVSLGALIGKPEYELEVLKDLTPDTLELGKQYIQNADINIKLKQGDVDKLYIEVICYAGNGRATAIIAGSHTNFVYVERNGEVVFDKRGGAAADVEDDDIQLNLRLVYEFATTAPLDEIRFILKTKEYNMKAAEESIKGNYGHCLGKTMDRPLSRGIFGNNIFSHILSRTASACDARMGGAMIPVMSNSGSGNQGICATNPVVVFAEENHNTAEEMTRALMLSHLTAIYIKQNLGTLSALCGCVVAATGSSCGITYLMGGGYEQVTFAVKNMIANLTGMICDGAKPSCAMKLTTGVSTAVLSAMLAMQGNCVTSVEGIIDDDVDQSIRNLVSIGADAMNETDHCVLDIMTHKH